MYYGLVHFLKFNTTLIDQFRKKYDPTHHIIKPHITVLFPVPDKIKEPVLINHINKVLNQSKSFSFHINGLYKSWDHWLFLTIKEGNSKIKKLHRDIYSGPLSEFLRKDIQFIPHISLGLFAKHRAFYNYKNPGMLELDSDKFETVYKEAEALKIDYKSTFDELYLLKLNDNFSYIEKYKQFVLNK